MTVATETLKQLLENGVHFGHQTNKWNPKMKKYIFGEKSGIYIIDLRKTEEALQKAVDAVRELTASGKKVLFVGTKKQAQDIVKEEAQKCGMYYVDERWLGGCLTNFTTIRKSVERLNLIQEQKTSGVLGTMSKKEKARVDHEEYKLLKNLEGIREMKTLPDCLVAVDAEAEHIAIREANKIGIPIVALIDTNSDPDMINFPIPGNDDAIRSIKCVISKVADAALKGSQEFASKRKAAAASKAESLPKAAGTEAPKEKPARVEVKEEPKKPETESVQEKQEEKPAENAVEGDINLEAGK
ncbi:MAG: 30S ribosomal protein S2 [Candidatus Omnitrophica bacterium]|nr:30S ribosomal protein S2 [Candidatus Omnitrophota bacterium]MDD5488312.1 30S ribosomal protein S2 [Candidatus Omnitrophota bacterium]